MKTLLAIVLVLGMTSCGSVSTEDSAISTSDTSRIDSITVTSCTLSADTCVKDSI